jgi:penicillin-binding protein 1A
LLDQLFKQVAFYIKLATFMLTTTAVIVFFVFYYYGRELPDYTQLESYDPPLVSRIYSQKGKLMQEYAFEKRVYIDYDQIPPIVIKAFLSAEDKNFYEHQGLDYLGIVRAAIQNILSLGSNRGLSGGSTITQQVVKNFLLTNERSVERKIKEAILAFRISRAYSKEKILELYLNQIFFGNNSYGLISASLNYFNKDVKDLTIAEAAMLAAMPKAPSQVNPLRNKDRAKARRDWVINRMLQDEFITEEQAQVAINEPIHLATRNQEFAANADYYSESVRQKLVDQYGEKAVYTQGYSVLTYMDDKMQTAATESLRKGIYKYDRQHGYRGPTTHFNGTSDEIIAAFKQWSLPEYTDTYQVALVTAVIPAKATISFKDNTTGVIPLEHLKWARKPKANQLVGPSIDSANAVLNVGDVVLVSHVKDGNYLLEQIPEVEGAIIAMEVGTGKVLAVAGGYSFKKSKFNRATQADRQPGSAFKPFVYLAALENGYEPNTVVDDSAVSVYQGPGLPMWTPKNYGSNFLGPITIRTALEKSRNVPTVKISMQLGIKKITELSSRLNIFSSPPQNLSVVLGAYETTLLKLTAAYNTIASGGRKITPQFIDHISNRRGATLEPPKIAQFNYKNDDGTPSISYFQKQIVDPELSYQLTSILEGAIQRGTGAKARQLNRHIAGKTGTTNDSFDTWFIGYTPDVVIGIYIGFDQPKTLGQKETGASIPLPIFIDFMQTVGSSLPDREFTIPEGIELTEIHTDGTLANSGEPGVGPVIKEAFRVGTHTTPNSNQPNSESIWQTTPDLGGLY